MRIVKGVELFEKFRTSPVFVETGTNEGNGVQRALDAGYDFIYSVENNIGKYAQCQNRFVSNFKVNLYLGHSPVVLESILRDNNGQATIWLDAHGKGRILPNATLMQELAVIKKLGHCYHNILIDDWDLMQNKAYAETIIHQINPYYKTELWSFNNSRKNQVKTWSTE